MDVEDDGCLVCGVSSRSFRGGPKMSLWVDRVSCRTGLHCSVFWRGWDVVVVGCLCGGSISFGEVDDQDLAGVRVEDFESFFRQLDSEGFVIR